MSKKYRILVSEVLCSSIEELTTSVDTDIAIDVYPDLWQQPQKLAAVVSDYDALMVINETQVTEDIIKAAPNLKVIGRLGVGIDNINMQTAKAAKITVVNAPSGNSDAVAELTIGQIINLLRHLPKIIHETMDGEWARYRYPGCEVRNLAIGLVGFGNIAQRVAHVLEVMGADISVATRRPEIVPSQYQSCNLDELFTRCRLISLHVPSTPQTVGIVNQKRLSIMSKGGYIVNTGRGDLIDENALLAALESGQLSGAALDVRQQEPPLPSRLEKHPNVLLTPHISGFTQQAKRRIELTVLKDVCAVLSGHLPQNPC